MTKIAHNLSNNLTIKIHTEYSFVTISFLFSEQNDLWSNRGISNHSRCILCGR